MRKAKALNGLPNDIVQMYFSTLAYHRNGYMADHLWETAMRTGVRQGRIDLLAHRVDPEEFSTPGILSYLPRLNEHIRSELRIKGFPPDHISSAEIKVVITPQNEIHGMLSGQGVILTKDGKRIEGRVYKENAYPLRGNTTARMETHSKPWWKFW
ncbi:MAG: hypothetical protein IT229_01955 [Flavobacteriales bacterium]|nr:hypothetical protein [Flavobacteriales bacterium]